MDNTTNYPNGMLSFVAVTRPGYGWKSGGAHVFLLLVDFAALPETTALDAQMTVGIESL